MLAVGGDRSVVGPQLCSARGVEYHSMKKLIPILVVSACALATTALAASYSVEATMTRQKDKGTYEVLVRVSHLVERDGKITEELVSQPKITSSPGVPASLYSGLQPPNPDYAEAENVSVDVAWPEVGKTDFAVCAITLKLGDKVVSKTKMKVTVEER